MGFWKDIVEVWAQSLMFVASYARLLPGSRFHLSVNVQIFPCTHYIGFFAVTIKLWVWVGSDRLFNALNHLVHYGSGPIAMRGTASAPFGPSITMRGAASVPLGPSLDMLLATSGHIPLNPAEVVKVNTLQGGRSLLRLQPQGQKERKSSTRQRC